MFRRSPARFAPSLMQLEDRLAPATFVVTSDDDSGTGTLRAAIQSANAQPGADAIEFHLQGGIGLYTISLASALPAITGTVAIKGQTQPGFVSTPLIELYGAGAGVGTHGFTVNAAAVGTVIRGLTITHFDGDGIRIRASNSRVVRCIIGTNPASLLGAGNGGNGVHILGGADGVTVGGNDSSLGNLISGNDGSGVLIEGVGTTGNKVQGNFIGTAANGASALPNNNGVFIYNGSSGNVIGGTSASARNVISGNTAAGVTLYGEGTTGNAIRGNLIGTDLTGSLTLGNGSGVSIASHVNGNTIGGTITSARNVISGNTNNGVTLGGNTGNVVQGNYIGVDVDGTADLGNGGNGVSIGSASGNVIGGLVAGARNVISGNGADGVRIVSGISPATGNKVRGNYIGTSASGNFAIGNDGRGVTIESGAHGNVIGGSIAGARNVISGNGLSGVGILNPGTNGNIVRGNFIGLAASGTAAIGNGNHGVGIVDGASSNVIGGTTPAARNVISGNGLNGIWISDVDTTGNTVLGNYIGTDKTGSVALGNGVNGVRISDGAALNLIGVTISGARNVISGNAVHGVLIEGAGTTANTVQGNYVGTDKTGSADLGNVQTGVVVFSGASNTVIGGTAVGAGNVISGNNDFGLYIGGAGTVNNRVRGNRIGLAATSAAALGNDTHGVGIDTSNTLIGGTAAGAGNVIAHNGFEGVYVASGTGNSILRNRIFSNGSLGIDLNFTGVTDNDANDADAGPNDRLNFPVLSLALATPTQLHITGSINTELNKTLRIEFFSSPTADASNYGEGQWYLGFIMVQTLAGNTVNFNTTLVVAGVLPGQVVTATATDQAGNTSEFSLALLVT